MFTLFFPKPRVELLDMFDYYIINFTHFQIDNGLLHIMCKTLRYTVSSAVEAETYGTFHNAKFSIPIVHLLTHMGHPQEQPTLICTDNSTSAGFVNCNMQMKQSKTWDMQLH